MGAKQGKPHMASITEHIEARVGKIPLSGRYHRNPKTIDDDYEVCNKVLGSGYNGVVRQANSRVNRGQKYAVKAFKLNNVSQEKRGQLESEVEIFLVMDHPHVARLMDVYESDDYLHLVMECMEGGELFDRVTALKRFSERDAADAMWQMLLALNYIHGHGIVHRDLKLENFLYEKKDGNHLKLIDFGFSKMWDPNIKMHVSCGTLSYVAPEVLEKSYTSQCDLWSLGVIVFILLAGYMPFSGKEDVQTRNISEGKYTMKPERWNNISKEAKHFVQSLLQVDPEKRLSADRALNHAWIEERHARPEDHVDEQVVDALRQFGQASKFRRACLEMCAWSLTNDDRAKVREYFLEMDTTHGGTITLAELRNVLVDKFHIPDEETKTIFAALDSNHDEEIHYSDFLAAMVSTRIALHDDLLRSAFNKFDTDSSGFISLDNLKEVLGETFDGEDVSKLLAEADQLQDGQISYAEFVSYIRGTPLDAHQDVAAKIIDTQAAKVTQGSGSIRGRSLMESKKSGGGGGEGASPKVGKKQPGCCAIM